MKDERRSSGMIFHIFLCSRRFSRTTINYLHTKIMFFIDNIILYSLKVHSNVFQLNIFYFNRFCKFILKRYFFYHEGHRSRNIEMRYLAQQIRICSRKQAQLPHMRVYLPREMMVYSQISEYVILIKMIQDKKRIFDNIEKKKKKMCCCT